MKNMLAVLVILFAGFTAAQPDFSPNPTDKTVNEGELLTITLITTAPDNGSTAFSISGEGAIEKISNTEARYAYTPSFDGATRDVDVIFEAKDSDSTDTATITITINNVNRAPSFTSTPAGNTAKAYANSPYSFTVTSTDADGDSLVYELVSGPAGLAMSAAGAITWTPTSSQIGTHDVTVSVTDGTIEEEAEFTLSVSNNRLPSFSVLPEDEDLYARADRSYSFTIKATDPDGDSIIYSLTTAPTGMGIEATTGKITWTPTTDQVGDNTVKVKASDGKDYVEESFNIDVVQKDMIEIIDADVSCKPDSCDDDDFDPDDLDGSTINDVRPGVTLEIDFEVRNLWDEDLDNHEITEIEICGTLEDIADEDEQEVCEDLDDLEPDDKTSATLSFTIPLEADEDDFSLDVTLKAEDEDGTDYEQDFTVTVTVNKETNKVEIVNAQFTPATVSCDREVELSVLVKNLGSKRENVELALVDRNKAGISLSEFFRLEEGDYDDEDTEYSKRFTFVLDSDLKAGKYPIQLKAYYKNKDTSTTKDLVLTVEECQKTTPTPKPTKTETPVETPKPTPTMPTGGVIIPIPTPTPTEDKEETSVWFVVVLAAVVIALIGVALWMLSIILKK